MDAKRADCEQSGQWNGHFVEECGRDSNGMRDILEADVAGGRTDDVDSLDQLDHFLSASQLVDRSTRVEAVLPFLDPLHSKGCVREFVTPGEY